MIPHRAPSIDRVRIFPGSAPSGNRAANPPSCQSRHACVIGSIADVTTFTVSQIDFDRETDRERELRGLLAQLARQ
jgi:hypothetical protein